MALRGFDDYEVKIGDLLRGERATHGYTIEAVAEKLVLSVEIIKAIEDGRVAPGKPEAMMSGFVRSYAKVLGIDPEDLCFAYWREVESSLRLQDNNAVRNPLNGDFPESSVNTLPQRGMIGHILNMLGIGAGK
jgi:cytoskeletal protein RodZ